MPALTHEQREQRLRELRERFADESGFCDSVPTRPAGGTSRPGGDVGCAAGPASETAEANGIVITPKVQALLDAKLPPGRRYPTPELGAEAKRLAQHIGFYRREVRRAAREGDRKRFALAVGHLWTLLAKREALLASVASERGAQTSPAAGETVYTADAPGRDCGAVYKVEVPDRGHDVCLRITGVWTGQTLSQLLRGLAETVAADSLRWRAQVEICPEEAAP